MFAERVKRIEESGTVRIANLVGELQAKGKDIISLSVGEPDFNTPRYIIEATITALNEGFTHYTPSNGILELREAIADKSKRENGIPCEASNVLVTPTKQAIFMSITALINEGDEVILPEPAWVTYKPCIKFAGGKPILIDTSKDDFHLTPEKIAECITQKTKMIILNSPSNPTGMVASKEELQGIADLAKDHNLIVLSDEIYEKILYEGRHYSIASFDGMVERTITVNGFSKAYAMTGWRLGWLVAEKSILSQIGKIQHHSITCATAFAQKGGVAALKGPQDSVREMVSEFKERRDLILKELSEIPYFHSQKPQGAFYVFPKFDFKISSMELAEFLLKEAGVAITPGNEFGTSGEGYIRISYATSKSNILNGIKRIKEAVQKIKKL